MVFVAVRAVRLGAALVTVLALAVFYSLGAVFLCESALRARRLPIPAPPAVAVRNGATISQWQSVEIRADDGVLLKAWLIVPNGRIGRCVVVLHGVGDTRLSGLGFAHMLVGQQYTVLLPDSRAHGESGGEIVTYGLLEAGDTKRWAQWLAESGCPDGVYGLGESLGAAVLLQSLSVGARFKAVVAECPFSDFARIARERIAQQLPLPLPVGRAIGLPAVWVAFHYAHWKYGLDFREVSPERTVWRTRTPVLLIHGKNDRNIPPSHSEAIAAGNGCHVVLWLVPGAGHSGAFGVAPDEFNRRVLYWFSSHPQQDDGSDPSIRGC